MNITITTDAVKAHKLLANLERGIRDTREPLDQTKKWLMNDIQQNFNSEGKRYGMWKPLAMMTQIERARLGYGAQHPILERTGNLKRSFTAKQSNNKLEIINNVKDKKTGEGYFNKHQLGGGRIPQRVMMDIDSVGTNAIVNYFVNWIVKLVRSYL
jgi:phage gpG-like protein